MVMNQQIQAYLEKLPAAYEEEVLDFLAFLLVKSEREEEKAWSKFSLAAAMRGMEKEPSIYKISDLKVKYE